MTILFLMAYDQHYATSEPGPLCDQRWIEKQLDEVQQVFLPARSYYAWRRMVMTGGMAPKPRR